MMPAILNEPLADRSIVESAVAGTARLSAQMKVSIAAAIYVLVYVAMYVEYVEPIFSPFGLTLRPDLSLIEVILLLIIAWVPSLLLPTRLSKPSDFLITIQYLLIYVPVVWVAINTTLPALARETAWSLILVLSAAMVIQLTANRVLPLYRFKFYQLGCRAFWLTLLLSNVLALTYIAFLLGGNFQLVALDEIYELRADSAKILQDSGSNLGAYLFHFTSSAFLPLMLALAIIKKSRFFISMGFIGYVFLFGLWGSKATLLAPLAIIAFAWLFRDLQQLMPIQLIKLFCVLLISPVAFVFADDGFRDFIVGWVVSLVHQRTFSSSALLIPQYFSFFEVHPYTLGSHIGLVGQFVEYPFHMDVPRMVGFYIYDGSMTANVNYWAQDGISSFGLWGVLIIAAVASSVFWILDCSARGLDPRFATLSLIFVGMNLSDTSLFTSLLSGGLFIIIIMFLTMPRGLAPDLNLSTSKI